MTNQKIALLAIVLTAPCAIVAAACSSAAVDSGGPAPAATTPPPREDAGAPRDSGAASRPDSSTPTQTPEPSADAGTTCAHPPTLPPSAGDAGVYCPFSRKAGGKDITCAPGEICCETPADAGSSTCNPGGATAACAVPKSIVWECEGPDQCAASATAKVCCGTVRSIGADPTCAGFQKASGFTSARCAASCGAGQYTLCTGPGDCSMGKVCTPLKAVGNAIGFCL